MNNKPLYVLCALGYALCLSDASAAIRVGNLSRSYAEAYNTVNARNAAAMPATPQAEAPIELPVHVANADLAAKIASGDASTGTNMADLDACAMIYPDGEFAWASPEVGLHRGAPMTCVAAVEIRTGADVVLGRAYLAAGDAMKCNISEFPQSSYTAEALKIEFPADREPTMDDVIQVMNDEQKKNAGLKIAAGTVIGGLMGNITGENEVGQHGMLGTGKGKMTNTAIGALSGAALMATNAYAGKVAGDTILSTGVNAAAGSAIGNIVASGNQVLRIEKCTLPDGKETSCLWGVLQTSKSVDLSKQHAYFSISTGDTVLCENMDQGCKPTQLANVQIEGYQDMDTAAEQNYQKVQNGDVTQYTYRNNKITEGYTGDANGIWVKITSAGLPVLQVAAMVSDVPNKTFGMKRSDWVKWRKDNSGAKIWGRDNSGKPYALSEKIGGQDYSLYDFDPWTENAGDGGLIDYGNRARMKSTLIGAGAGAGLGALAGYTGAQAEVEDRWTTEVRQYQDSLKKVYCATGKRFLSHYNDEVGIPPMKQ